MSWTAFPGGDLIEQGLRDLEQERESVYSLLVSIGAPRLRHLIAGAGKLLPYSGKARR